MQANFSIQIPFSSSPFSHPAPFLLPFASNKLFSHSPSFCSLLFIPINRKETKWYHGWFNMSGGSQRVNLCAGVRDGTSSLASTMLRKTASSHYFIYLFFHFKFLEKQINPEGRRLLQLWSFRGRCWAMSGQQCNGMPEMLWMSSVYRHTCVPAHIYYNNTRQT